MSDCWTCVRSKGCDYKTLQRLMTQNYSRGEGSPKDEMWIFCEDRRIVAPTKCEGYVRDPGSDDDVVS